jgi:hypothetical protein
MDQTYTKNYNIDTFSELVSDLQTAYEWHNVVTAEDGTYAYFYATETAWIHFFISNNTIGIKINKGNEIVINIGGNAWINSKTTKTRNVFCFSCFLYSSSYTLTGNENLYSFIIGKAINQLTSQEETVLAVTQQYSNNISSIILSSDNATEPIRLTQITYLNYNFSSKITMMQNVFSKYSECIMKDVYVLTSLQFPAISFNDCTLNGKKYYMQGAILLADD